MADTLTVSINPTYQSIVGKTLSTQAELLSKLKVAIVDVDYDTVDYDIGGNTLDLTLGSRFTTIIAVEVLEVSIGVLPQYVPAALGAAATGKLKIYESEAAGSEPFDEADDADTLTLTCKLRIYGF